MHIVTTADDEGEECQHLLLHGDDILPLSLPTSY